MKPPHSGARMTFGAEVDGASGGRQEELAVVPLSFQRGTQPTATAESAVAVTYRNPDCPLVGVETPGSPVAGTPPETQDGAE